MLLEFLGHKIHKFTLLCRGYRRLRNVHRSVSSELKEAFQSLHALCAAALQVYLIGSHGRINYHLVS